MATRVVLHVGAHKTGTTYLQQLLWTNREPLAAAGVELPLGTRRHHYDVVADLRGGVWAEQHLDHDWGDLVAAVRDIEGIAVLSEELLCVSPPEVVERIVSSLAPTPVHVVYAARDLGRQVPAQWQQVVRARAVSPYADFVRVLREHESASFWDVQDPVVNVARWRAVLPPEQVHLLIVPRRGSPPRLLWERFASIVGVDPDVAVPVDRTNNDSLGLVETELMRRLNAQLADDEFPMRQPYLQHVHRWLMRPALLGGQTERIGVPPEHADWLVERADRMVEAVRGLDVHVVGDPEELRADVRLAERSPADIPEAELLDRALRGWSDQIGKVVVRERELQSRLRRLRSELRERNRAPKPRSRVRRGARRVAGGLRRRARRLLGSGRTGA